MQAALTTFVKRFPFLTFMLLACAFSWWLWPLYVLELSTAVIVGFGPFLAAVAVLGLTGGRPAVKTLLRQMVNWRVALRWYGIALALPIILTGMVSALNVMLSAPAPSAEQLAQWPSILPAFLMLLFVPGIGGGWEEPGWRGYALRELATRRSQLRDYYSRREPRGPTADCRVREDTSPCLPPLRTERDCFQSLRSSPQQTLNRTHLM